MSDIKLPCKMEPWYGRVVDDNDMYVEIDHVLRCVNYHHRLREALGDVVDEWVYGDDIFGPIKKARALLEELDNLEEDGD